MPVGAGLVLDRFVCDVHEGILQRDAEWREFVEDQTGLERELTNPLGPQAVDLHRVDEE